jgi:hypothetical protein
MRRKNLHHCLVFIVRVGLRGADRLRSACRPRALIVVRAIVRVAGGDGEHAELLAVHVLVAAAAGTALTLAAAFTGGPASELLKVLRTLAIGAVAVSAALLLVQRARGPAQSARVRPLLLLTTRRIAPREAQLPAARALQLACDPGALWTGTDPIRLVVRYAARKALSQVTTRPITQLSPVIGPALDLVGAYRNTLDSARFVRQFALTAVEVSRDPSLLALS